MRLRESENAPARAGGKKAPLPARRTSGFLTACMWALLVLLGSVSHVAAQPTAQPPALSAVDLHADRVTKLQTLAKDLLAVSTKSQDDAWTATKAATTLRMTAAADAAQTTVDDAIAARGKTKEKVDGLTAEKAKLVNATTAADKNRLAKIEGQLRVLRAEAATQDAAVALARLQLEAAKKGG